MVTEKDVICIKLNEWIQRKAEDFVKRYSNSFIDRIDLEPRSAEQRRKDILRGKQVEFGIVWFFRECKKKYVFHWSEIHPDSENEEYDLIAKSEKMNEIAINVKSSGPRNAPDLETVLSRRRLATKPSAIKNDTIVSKGEELDINIQAYYLTDQENIFYIIGFWFLDDLIELFGHKKITIGIKAKHKMEVTQYSYNNPRKVYNKPLKFMRPISELLEILKDN